MGLFSAIQAVHILWESGNNPCFKDGAIVHLLPGKTVSFIANFPPGIICFSLYDQRDMVGWKECWLSAQKAVWLREEMGKSSSSPLGRRIVSVKIAKKAFLIAYGIYQQGFLLVVLLMLTWVAEDSRRDSCPWALGLLRCVCRLFPPTIAVQESHPQCYLSRLVSFLPLVPVNRWHCCCRGARGARSIPSFVSLLASTEEKDKPDGS